MKVVFGIYRKSTCRDTEINRNSCREEKYRKAVFVYECMIKWILYGKYAFKLRGNKNRSVM
jgi:hypothetical protein